MGAHATSHEVSRHKCLIYDGDAAEQLPVVVPLLEEGLSDNWRCLYLGSPDAIQMVDAALTAKGVDTHREMGRKALVLSSDRSHLKDGRFDPGAMVDGLRSAIDESLRAGFHGLCATGDMRWELGADENFDRLLEYEARLEQVFREMPLRGVCQYHRGMVPAQAVEDALVTHRSTYLGHRLNQDNLFYVPPELLLQARESGDTQYAEWMCQQLSRVMDAERVRDEVLRDLERRVAERTAELSVANRQLRAFSYSVSHDLRAPLRAINGFGAALAEDAGEQLNPESRAHLAHILTATKEMSELIEGMLILGRVVEAEMRRAPVDLGKIACDVASGLRASEPTRTVEFVVHDDLHTIGDPALLRAALANLLENAWKFTARRASARIEVGRRATTGGCAFFVRDNGAGFDMDYAHKLFGPFQRLHGRAEFEGTGVGLATVERIISRHGGQIWAEGVVDHGATFLFTLPENGQSDARNPASTVSKISA
jgi:signal transduction histidine kinase